MAITPGLARADDAERLDRALKTLRGRVWAASDTPEGNLFMWSSVTTGVGLVVTTIAGVGVVAVQPPISRWAYRFLASSAALTAGSYAVARIAHHRVKYDPTPPPPPGPPARYRTPEGLHEFMRLTPAQQKRLAEDHPDFAAFLIEVAESYHRWTDAQFRPEVLR